MRASRSGCTLASRWMVATTYPPGASSSRSRTVDRSRAIGPSRKHASAMTSPTTSIRPGTPSPRRISAERSSGESSSAATRSTATRFRSSGIDQSPLRRPASTCATGIAGVERRLGPGERRVRIAVHERPVRPLRLERGRDPRPHPLRVRGMQVEPVRRLRQPQLLEEDLGQLAVPVLAGVQRHLVDAGLPQRHGERAGLDELRPVADHRENLHECEATMAAAFAGPLAQLVEQGTLNPKVEGSNPSRPTCRAAAACGTRRRP